MAKIQIVLDTNVLVAAFRSRRGAANFLVDRLDDARWQLNVSNALILEYEDVLARNDMRPFISHAEVNKTINAVCSISRFHSIFFLWRFLSRDPDDNFIIELAIKASADYIVTFNKKDLSRAAEFGIKLVTPREFLECVGDSI